MVACDCSCWCGYRGSTRQRRLLQIRLLLRGNASRRRALVSACICRESLALARAELLAPTVVVVERLAARFV
jgi:hypothetical protein